MKRIGGTFREFAAANGKLEVVVKMEKMEQRRQQQIFDLCDFERNFVANLLDFKNVVIEPFLEKKWEVVKQQDLENLFCNILDLLAINIEFCFHLINQQKEEVFIDKLLGEDQFLKKLVPLYREFERGHEALSRALSDLEQIAEFNETRVECWKNLKRQDVDFYSYLSLPVYQLVQYPLLFGKILKNTRESHVDYQYLVTGIPELTNAAKTMKETFLRVQTQHQKNK